jgi:hypothetical protein
MGIVSTSERLRNHRRRDEGQEEGHYELAADHAVIADLAAVAEQRFGQGILLGEPGREVEPALVHGHEQLVDERLALEPATRVELPVLRIRRAAGSSLMGGTAAPPDTRCESHRGRGCQRPLRGEQPPPTVQSSGAASDEEGIRFGGIQTSLHRRGGTGQ